MTAMRTRARGSLRRSAGVVAAAAVVALAIWALARLLDVELTVGKGADANPVGPASVLVTVLVAGLAAWGCTRCWSAAGPRAGGRSSAAPRWPSWSSGRPGWRTAWRQSC